MGGDAILYLPEGGGNSSTVATIGGRVPQPSLVLSRPVACEGVLVECLGSHYGIW